MKYVKIEVDEDVYGYLQKMAVAYIEDPNMTLRRLLGLDKNQIEEPRVKIIGRKKQKSDSIILIKNGFLEDGQILYLHDFRGNRLSYQARLSKNRLVWEGNDYSMSKLASNLLKKEGYKSNEVQGPARWFTDDGVSIKQLWEKYLSKESRKTGLADI